MIRNSPHCERIPEDVYDALECIVYDAVSGEYAFNPSFYLIDPDTLDVIRRWAHDCDEDDIPDIIHLVIDEAFRVEVVDDDGGPYSSIGLASEIIDTLRVFLDDTDEE